MREVDWYFDFVSPFSYLQWMRLDELGAVAPRFHPVLFAGLLQHWGQLGPAEIPAKRRFTYRYVTWLARRLDIALRFPPGHPFNPLPALRLALALGLERAALDGIFRFIWAHGRDPGADWDALCVELGVDAADARRRAEAPEVKGALRAGTERAIEVGVFGVPSLVVDGELFWGFDATSMAVEFLRRPEAFDDDEMRRVGALPAAAQRRRA